MPEPTPSDVHIDQLLTNILIAYMNQPDAWIADTLFPIVSVRKQSNKIPKHTKEDFFRDKADMRSPGTESKGSGFTVSSSTYFCDNYATHVNVDDETRDNQDDPFDVDAAATRLVNERLKLRREVAWATDFFTTSVWDTDLTGGTNFVKWDDYGNSAPIIDLETGAENIHSVTGKEPTDFTMGRQVWTQVRHHPDFIERIKYSQRAIVTTELIASLLGFQRVNIGRAIKVSSAEGATTTFAYVFGKNALLSYVPSGPSLMEPAAGYTFVWTRRGGIAYTRRIRDDKAQYDRIEGHTFFDQKVVGADLGNFFSSAVA